MLIKSNEKIYFQSYLIIVLLVTAIIKCSCWVYGLCAFWNATFLRIKRIVEPFMSLNLFRTREHQFSSLLHCNRPYILISRPETSRDLHFFVIYKLRFSGLEIKKFWKFLFQSLALVTLIDPRKFHVSQFMLTVSKNGINLSQWVSLGRSRRVKMKPSQRIYIFSSQFD